VTALLDFDTTFIEFNEIYLILEASEADLSQIIRSGQALSDAHLQYFVAQLLRGVRYMHAANVLHRDLKPGNLLVNADCQLKLCDFGLARAYAERQEDKEVGVGSTTPGTPDEFQSAAMKERTFPDSPKNNDNSPASPLANVVNEQPRRLQTTALNFPGGPLTEYVATRWYRAPEIMLCFRRGYGEQIDMWSVGCIIAELLGGKPIFAGKDYVDQIARINNVLGSPNLSTIAKIGSERAKTYVESLPNMPAVPFSKLYPSASGPAIDLLSKLLCWDPDDRISAEEALQHPWLKAYHKSNDNWSPPPPFSRFEEVELLKTIGDFQMGLEREADEMRAELEALQAEEEAASQEGHQTIPSSEITSPSSNGDGDDEAGDDASQGSEAAKDDKSSSSQSALGSSTTRMSRSVSSPGASPIPTPSSLATSGNETSPTYETDLTSASAPHSVTGNNSAKQGRTRVMDGLGLMQSQQQQQQYQIDNHSDIHRERRALDETLANHGLLCGDDTNQVEFLHGNRSKFRRRALTNAPSRMLTLRRHGSEVSLRCPQIMRGKNDDDGEDNVKTIDITRRSSMQREEHGRVVDYTNDISSWLLLSSSSWTTRDGRRMPCHINHHDIVSGTITSREGSDTTAVGPGTADTAQHSPVAI